jgi:elongation factor P
MKANEIKKGMVILVDGHNIIIKHIMVQSPHSRGGATLYKTRGHNIVSRAKFERSFKGDENVDAVDFSRRAVQLLFRDSDGCTFMDGETYEQFTIADSVIEDELPFITDGLEGMQALVAEDQVIGIELPTTVNLEIVECSPGMKGASASARTKPATLTTGLVVQVPEYLEIGDVIKVNTDSREYISRA